MDESATAREPFARYYVRWLISRKGYKLGVVTPAQELLQHCDYVLTKAAGNVISTLCIVDRESEGGKTFTLSPVDLARVARETIAAQQTPIALRITILEIGVGEIDRAAKSRLAAYKGRGKGYRTAAVFVDTHAQRAWPLPAFGRRFSLAGQIERLMRAPRLAAADLAGPILPAQLSRPVFTFGLMALLAAIFLCEQAFNIGKSGGLAAPSLLTLQTLGGLSYPLVTQAGQWWRLFTAPLLHADLTHIGFNCFALFLIGRLLEPLVGWRWTAAAFAISAISGSLMSLAVNPANIIGIGASGGIVGLFAVALVVCLRIPAGLVRTRLVTQALYGLVPALLPFLNAATSGGKVDYGAHFGGAIGGVTLGFILLALWPAQRPRPRLSNLAALIAIAFFTIAAGSLLPIREQYRQQALLAPDLPETVAEQKAQVDRLLHDYPRDPRLHFIHAQSLLEKNDVAGAEADLRAAFAEPELIESSAGSQFESQIRALLAAVLREEGKAAEAKAIAAPACAAEKAGAVADYLKRFSLCE
jgi:rhomboid protease GluP